MDKSEKTLFSIGYGNRKVEDFIALLKKYGIRFLADLRSKPFSKFNPAFSKDRLEAVLAAHGIKYVFMGDTLGGQPPDPSCYTDGFVDYKKVESKEFYKRGIERLRSASEQGIPLVLMCSEGKPHECHRSKLVGVTLSGYQIDVQHINETGALASQEQVISKLRNNQGSLFEEEASFTSRKKYLST